MRSVPGGRWAQLIPAIKWLRSYSRADLGSDLFAGVITAILLVPQGIAYALLAGLPPEVGLYASMLPPAVYALFGTSRTLSVGPVSVAAIMVAGALSIPEIKALGDPVGSAMVLALECGSVLLLMASLRMGSLVNFISHPVLAGFTSGAAILIIASQLPHLLGLPSWDCALRDIDCHWHYLRQWQPETAAIGVGSMLALGAFGTPLVRLLRRRGLPTPAVTGISKSGPLVVVLLSSVLVVHLGVNNAPVATVGAVPAGLPALKFAVLDAQAWGLLLPSALFIALIAYVESVAIAKVTANLRRQRIDPNQELIALGAASLAAGCSGSMPVAGGFSRTMVNYAAGARSQMATLIAAMLLAVSVIFFTPLFTNIPKAALAAIILVAIVSLVRIKSMIHTWRYDRAEGLSELATLLGVLSLGIEAGLALGIGLTLLGYLWRTSRPHIAVVGRLPGTEHFRNIRRHQVETWPGLLLMRVDENLSFANAGFVEDFLAAELASRPQVRHLVLICTAISHIDTTALESLEQTIASLREAGVTLHLAEVKGPVMDRLQATALMQVLPPGKIYFRTSEAVEELGAGGSV